MVGGIQQQVWGVYWVDPIEQLWGVWEKEGQSLEAPPHNLQGLKNLLLMAWCTAYLKKSVMEPMPHCIRDDLSGKGRPSQ